MTRKTLTAALCLCITAGFCTTAHAQSGAALMLKPWAPGTRAEIGRGATFFETNSVEGPGHVRQQQTWYEAVGRLRLDPDSRSSPAVGFDILHIDLDTTGGSFADALVDYSAAVGFALGEFDGWELGATVGGGFAGDNPFADSHGLYARANLFALYAIDDHSGWQVVLNYHGNRTIFPDLPLPGVLYYDRVDERLRYAVGFPYSTVTWTPLDQLTLEAKWNLLVNFDASVTYAVLETLDLYGLVESRRRAFHLDDTSEHRRLFLSQRRAEAGVRWTPVEWIDLTAAGGYAFDQEYQTGFDVRDLDNDREMSDTPYLRFGFDVRF